MSTVDLLVLALFIFCMAALLAIWYTILLDKEEIDKKEQADIEWLNNEKLQPRYRIQFIIKLGNSNHPVCTSTFEPANSYAGSSWNIRYTSKNLAEIGLKNLYERGYFTDEAGITYPVCQVLQACIQEVDSAKTCRKES